MSAMTAPSTSNEKTKPVDKNASAAMWDAMQWDLDGKPKPEVAFMAKKKQRGKPDHDDLFKGYGHTTPWKSETNEQFVAYDLAKLDRVTIVDRTGSTLSLAADADA